MNKSSTRLQRLIVLIWTVAAWTAWYGVAWAQESEGGGGGGGAGAQTYAVPYAIVILCIGLGMLFLCRPARRRERPKGEQYEVAAHAEIGKKETVPVLTVGMRVDQVNKLLGKPRICRRGDDIYRELAQAGKLSEDDAAKEYSIYEHPAGRYEIVSFDRRVIEIKRQPKREEPEPV